VFYLTFKGVLNSKKWRISELNENYAFCDTYPKWLVVPSSTSDEELKLIGEFRSRNRIPVLSWLSKSENENYASILRSSQPLCGMSGKRNYWDELHLKKIAETNDKNKSLNIMDARPYLNALANCPTGGGYENEKYYTQCKLTFLNIENIHQMRDSLGTNQERDFFSNLENSKWLDHIRAILNGALKVVESVSIQYTSVLVHCSDGWDRTAQVIHS
jgi:myotubularin-related protein 1/2